MSSPLSRQVGVPDIGAEDISQELFNKEQVLRELGSRDDALRASAAGKLGRYVRIADWLFCAVN